MYSTGPSYSYLARKAYHKAAMMTTTPNIRQAQFICLINWSANESKSADHGKVQLGCRLYLRCGWVWCTWEEKKDGKQREPTQCGDVDP